MIERRCRIMKACSFFTCRLYTVQASAPYSRVDSTTARYILPLTRMDMWWLFQSLWRSRPTDTLALATLIVNASSTSYSACQVGQFQNRVQLVSINHDILLSGTCRVGLVQHLGLLVVNLQAKLLCRIREGIMYYLIKRVSLLNLLFQFRPENQSASLPYSSLKPPGGNIGRAIISQVDVTG